MDVTLVNKATGKKTNINLWEDVDFWADVLSEIDAESLSDCYIDELQSPNDRADGIIDIINRFDNNQWDAYFASIECLSTNERIFELLPAVIELISRHKIVYHDNLRSFEAFGRELAKNPPRGVIWRFIEFTGGWLECRI